MLAGLTGCGAGLATSAAPAASAAALSGNVHGGQQAVSGAHVYLYAAFSATSGETSYSSISLLNGPGYVVSDSNGNFSITGDYTCPNGAYVYILALGGNPGLAAGTNNAELALASGLGPCASLNAGSFFSINELTTVATAYSLAAFATSETKIGSTPAFAVGLGNAFANIPNIVDVTHGGTMATTPGGNGTLPEATIDSLANSLAACVNSNGSGTPCSTLMSAANVGASSGNPVDTFQAALNIAHHPGVNVSAIYNVAAAAGVFEPALTSAPNDWTITVQYAAALNPDTTPGNTCYATGMPFTDLCQTQGIAIDAAGDVWLSNLNPDYNGGNYVATFEHGSLVKFSPVGVEVSPPGGYTSPSLYKPQELAFDTSGNLWVPSRASTQNGVSYPDSLQEFSSAGVPLSGVAGYTGGGLVTPRAVAIDGYGNIWVGGNGEFSEFLSNGTEVSGSGYTYASPVPSFDMSFDSKGNLWNTTTDNTAGNQELVEFVPLSESFNLQGTYGGSSNLYADGSATYPTGLAIDASDHIWLSNTFAPGFTGTGFLSEYSNQGQLLSPAGGYTGGGIAYPNNVVIDGSGNVFGIDSPLGEITNAGVAISPSTGYQSANPNDCCLQGAIDESGNLWLSGSVAVYQMIGIATPVVTPILAPVPPTQTASFKK